MSDNFLDIELVPKMIRQDWTVREVLEEINKGELTAYVRIYCEDEDEDEDEVVTRYEIAVIENVRQCSQNSQKGGTTWYIVDCFPIKASQDDGYEYHRANIAFDEHCGERVFNNLKSNLPNSYVTVDQICLLHFDVLKFIQNIAKNEAVDLHRVGSTENESVVSVSETPEQFIFRLRLSGEQNEVIAVHLHNKFSSLNGYTKMKLINPEKVNHWEQQRVKIGRIRQMFYDLKKKGLTILEEREKMTSSEMSDETSEICDLPS